MADLFCRPGFPAHLWTYEAGVYMQALGQIREVVLGWPRHLFLAAADMVGPSTIE
jgi:hypothetical protein